MNLGDRIKGYEKVSYNSALKMSDINNRLPVRMEFTVASITDGIEYWLTNVVLKENIVVDDIIWNSNLSVFSVKLARGIQVGQKL